MKHQPFFLLVIVSGFLFLSEQARAQISAPLQDTSGLLLQSDAIYNRPFLQNNKLPFAVGGYLDVNTYYGGSDGGKTGFSFEIPDFTLFVSSRLNRKMRFLSELTFASNLKQVQLRYAALDVQLHNLFNLRGGLVLNPIGAFNQNHDGPNYEFVDRPLSATTLIPGIFSNAGFGLYGKTKGTDWVLGYELYATNGFNDKIIDNTLERTALPEGVSGVENFSGKAMYTGKLALKNRLAGELGVSYLRGVYSAWEADEQKVAIFAVDYSGSFLHNRLNIRGELAKVKLDVPDTYIQTYGKTQMGAYVDVVGTIIERPILGWENAKINLALRLEYVDYNQDAFTETGGGIAEHVRAIMPGISFRPSDKTVFRVNYRFQEQTDFLGNLPSKSAAIQFGLSSYF
jgi:hypothetical protein